MARAFDGIVRGAGGVQAPPGRRPPKLCTRGNLASGLGQVGRIGRASGANRTCFVPTEKIHVKRKNLMKCHSWHDLTGVLNGVLIGCQQRQRRPRMRCKICNGQTTVTSTFDNEVYKLRYRQCQECGTKMRTFEEWDTNPTVRHKEIVPLVPLGDPANVTCPDCNGETTHIKQRKTTKKVTRQFRCNGCKTHFGIETDLSDPIGRAREKKRQEARAICPKCDGPTRSKGLRRGRHKTTRRHECHDCGHRFAVVVSQTPDPHDPPIIREGEIEHRVLP